MTWRKVTVGELYEYYLDNDWNGSANLIRKQAEEILKEKENKKAMWQCNSCDRWAESFSIPCMFCGSSDGYSHVKGEE